MSNPLAAQMRAIAAQMTATAAELVAAAASLDVVATPPPRPPLQPTAADIAAFPGTKNWGDWRDVQPGESPEAYWNRTHLAGYGRTTAELKQIQDELAAQTELGRLLASERYNGPIPVGELSDAEKAFLTYVTANYRLAAAVTQSDAWFAICAGTLTEINAAIADGDRIAGHGGYDPGTYPAGGRLRGLVDAVATGTLRVSVSH